MTINKKKLILKKADCKLYCFQKNDQYYQNGHMIQKLKKQEKTVQSGAVNTTYNHDQYYQCYL